MLEESGCVRGLDVRANNTIIFNVENDNLKLAEGIKDCATNHNMGQWQSRMVVADNIKTIELIHLSW